MTTCKIDLTVTATRFCNNRVYYENLRPQKEVPWMMGLRIDTSRILPAALSPSPQSQWPRLVSSNRKLIATVIFNAHSVLRQLLKEHVLHRVPSSASYFKFQYLPLPSEKSNSCLRPVHRLHVTCIIVSTFPSITCFRRQFLRKM